MKMKLSMTYSVSSKIASLYIFFVMACTERIKKGNTELENKINAVSQFAVIDLDRCNSCFSEYADKLNLETTDSSTLVIVLSNSRKKAFLFERENNLKILWDSTRYFESYLERSSYHIQVNPLKK